MAKSGLGLDESARADLWGQVERALEDYWLRVSDLPIVPELDPEPIRAELSRFDFKTPTEPTAAVEFVVRNLTRNQTHFSHPGYMGLFVPNPTAMSVFADALATGFNTQLATWHSSPFAVELERHLVREVGALFGYAPEIVSGTFTSGGSEANHTAVLVALRDRCPEIAERGLRGLRAQPAVYVSREAHHSLHKAVMACGLGRDHLREIPVNDRLEMDVEILSRTIAEDRARGLHPLMVVATVGSASAGAVDPIQAIARVALSEGLWLHLDACYGGAAAILPELAHIFGGAGEADSIAFDPHKWLSVSVGTGMFLTRHRGSLARTFHVETPYATKASDHLDVVQPYTSSLQWSRGFAGLKFFLSLAVEGWSGYVASLRRQRELALDLRARLEASAWRMENKTDLPVICFSDLLRPDGASSEFLNQVARKVVDTGRFWISTTRLAGTKCALRVAIANHRTGAQETAILVETLNRVRSQLPRA